MRKILTVTYLIIISLTTYSQQWMDLGVKATYGSTWLLNNNIFKDRNYNHDFSAGGGYGFKFGYNFNQNVAVTAEVLWESLNQKFEVLNVNSGKTWDQNIKMKGMQIPLLFRNNVEGAYFEIGPQYNIVKSVTETLDETNRDVTNLFEKSYFSGVLGFGSYFIGTDNTALTVGIRISYGFNDLISKAGGNGFPEAYPTGGQPVDSDYYYPEFEAYTPTNALKVMFVFELNHDFGYMVSASCGKRSKLILFDL